MMPSHQAEGYLVVEVKQENTSRVIHRRNMNEVQMSATHTSTEDQHEPGRYEIRLKGHLDARWADWFEHMSFTHASDGTTILAGPVVDQAALYGLLRKVRDLGLPLLAVNLVDLKQADRPDGNVDTDHKNKEKNT
jgi:hypothetical protein